MKKLFLLFIDGIGLSQKTNDNPVSRLFENETDGFGLQETTDPRIFSRSILSPLDATLGIKRIPQSATGQTSIFTGINAAEYLGYHLAAFPNEKLVSVIMDKSIMKILKEKGIVVTSANMYSQKFFTDRRRSKKNRFPVSTLTIEASKSKFRMIEEYNEGKAVFADITNELMQKRGYSIETTTPVKAAEKIVSIMKENDFVFFEYFLTDYYGHKKDLPALGNCISLLNQFVSSIVEDMDLNNESILIVSDHGNAEDLSTSNHTYNSVPGLLISQDKTARDRFTKCKSITHMYKFMLDYFLQ